MMYTYYLCEAGTVEPPVNGLMRVIPYEWSYIHGIDRMACAEFVYCRALSPEEIAGTGLAAEPAD